MSQTPPEIRTPRGPQLPKTQRPHQPAAPRSDARGASHKLRSPPGDSFYRGFFDGESDISDFSDTASSLPLSAPEGGGGIDNNAFAIAVLVIAIVAIVVCIIVVFVVKPCPKRRRTDVVDVVVAEASGAAVGNRDSVAGEAAARLHGAKGGHPAVEHPAVEHPASDAEADAALGGEGHKLAMFHATWCGHCKAMKPNMQAAAADPDFPASVGVVMVDGDKCPRTVQAHGIRGYPTVKMLKDGKEAEEYRGNRTKQSLVDFARKHAGK